MGANHFFTYATGKTIDEAFNTAVVEARHWHGHGGHTGTIAEKHEFVPVSLPPRWTARKLDELLELSGPTRRGEIKLGKARPLTGHFAADELRRLVEQHHDEWGPALGVRLGPAEAKRVIAELRTRVRRTQVSSLPHGLRVFAFFGFASC